MGDNRRVHLNIASNALNTGINAAAGLITLPFLIDRLGAESYGLWVLVSASAGMFMLVDFGMPAAVGRRIASSRYHGDDSTIDSVISTSLCMLAGAALLVVAATLFLVQAFPVIFPVPVEKLSDVRTALLISGIASAIYFPAAAFDGILWGQERFDLHNAVEIPAVLLRLAGILSFVGESTSLTELALIVAVPAVASYAVRTMISVRLQPGLSVSPRWFDKVMMRELALFGGWFGVVTLARTSLPSAATFVIGATLGPVAVTVFTVPRLLVSYAHWVLASVSQVVAPKAAVLHHIADDRGQKRLFIESSRYAIALAVFICAGLLQFGGTFLQLWLPRQSGVEYRILVILALAEALPLSQWVSYNVIVSMAKHRALARLALSELMLVFSGALLGAWLGGLVGVALVCAAAAFIFRGVWTAYVAAKLVGLDPRTYLVRILGSTAVVAAIPAAALSTLPLPEAAAGWMPFVAAVAVYCILYAAATLAVFNLLHRRAGRTQAPSEYIPSRRQERHEA